MTTDQFYVATDRNGVEHANSGDQKWNLPTQDGQTWRPGLPTRSSASPLVLRDAHALLSELDELIFVAVPGDPATTEPHEGSVSVNEATLIGGTNWNLTSAAQFALDCAEHAVGDLLDTELPNGSTFRAIIEDARIVLERTEPGAESRLGRIAALALVRRLRKNGEQVSDLVRTYLTEDTDQDVDALDDPNYTATASIVDALLAATEAVRHFALPRYIDAREESTERGLDDEPSLVPSLITTPWGPISIGAEHHSPYSASWTAARDAASRARDAAFDRGSDEAKEKEAAWQAERLTKVLSL